MKNAPIKGPVATLATVAALFAGAGAAHATPPPPTATIAERAVSTARALPAMPRAFRLALHEQYQSTNYFCVPASTSMSLATFGVRIDQAALARKMRTTTRGTGGDNAATVMDSYLHPRRFDDRIVGDVVGHPEILMQRVSYDVGSLRRAPVIQVWMEKLPWNQGRLKGQWIGHAIVAYGYDQQAGTITVFDPWRPTGGTHTLPAKSLATTLQNGSGMHYISRT
ncbi:C39 family peptidase [Actinomadura sp. DC4]|uniref:C39 family peptidase n=1 Tax=Actinomadura sp. DC4 TaxID=3055069 RepID=UPI0025B026EC|nr:C39 family peptidase [Actinomadura sp. DC4]MDN3353133.1 C39 family peptidase [Actinomadura sp. DC4]